jgi:hypothetical protein
MSRPALTAGLATLLALASCQRQLASDDCNAVIDCLSSRYGIVLGSDAAARVAAMRELRSAAAAYSDWLDGKVPPPGLVILDLKAAHNAKFIRESEWTLNFARSGSGQSGGGEELIRRGDTPFTASETSGEFDVTRPGILAHEICHYHASRAFKQAQGGSSRLPDMLDEVAAISCESEDMKNERVRQFAQSFTQRSFIAWTAFLETRHPLKNQEAMNAINRLAKPASGVVAFDIPPGSAYGSKLAIFYSQAAAFGAFLDARSCKGKQAFGQLLSTYDPRQGLDRWLHSNGARFCLPSSVAAFEESFSQYIEQSRAGRS